jgi:uncharacterized protein YhfF
MNESNEAEPPGWRDLEQFAFGDTPEMADELLALVLAGTKTATSSAVAEYAAEGEEIDLTVGGRSVVLDGRGRPACVIETSEVAIRRFDEVDAAFAWDEGEGDRSLAYWRAEHELFFRKHGVFCEDMQLVCERFRLVQVLPRGEAPE